MARNRFEQVDERVDDAISVILGKRDDKAVAIVHCPVTAKPGVLPRDYNSPEMPGLDALTAAVKLANELKLAIVIVDTEAVWDAKWGDLYREDFGDEEEPAGEPAKDA